MSDKRNKKNIKMDIAIRNILLNQEFIFKTKFINEFIDDYNKKINVSIEEISTKILDKSDEEKTEAINKLKETIEYVEKFMKSSFKIIDFKEGVVYLENDKQIKHKILFDDLLTKTIHEIDINKIKELIISMNPEIDTVTEILQNVAENFVQEN